MHVQIINLSTHPVHPQCSHWCCTCIYLLVHSARQGTKRYRQQEVGCVTHTPLLISCMVHGIISWVHTWDEETAPPNMVSLSAGYCSMQLISHFEGWRHHCTSTLQQSQKRMDKCSFMFLWWLKKTTLAMNCAIRQCNFGRVGDPTQLEADVIHYEVPPGGSYHKPVAAEKES